MKPGTTIEIAVLDGLYVHLDGDQAQAFRFQPDGVVLDALLRKDRDEAWGDLTQVHTWLRAGAAGVVTASYTMSGGRVRLETLGHFGDGERFTIWEGAMRGEKLVLEFFDHVSSKRGKGRVFELIAPPRLPRRRSRIIDRR